MWEDPIVAEVHRTREKLLAKFNYDLDAFFEDLMRRQLEHADRLVSRVQPVARPDEPRTVNPTPDVEPADNLKT
jgi:hypothetical protein